MLMKNNKIMNKIIKIGSPLLLTILPVSLSVSCKKTPELDQFIIDKAKVKFDSNYVIDDQDNAKLDLWMFRLSFPNQVQLQEEINKINKLVAKDSSLLKIYPWIKDIKPELTDFTMDYLWGRNLIKVENNFPAKSNLKIELRVISHPSTLTKFNITFRLSNKNNNEIYSNINISNYDVTFLKPISKNHNHITASIVNELGNNLKEMLKFNSSSI